MMERTGSVAGHCWLQANSLVVYSCYLSPNQLLSTFESHLRLLEDSVRRIPPIDVIIAGDFNVKSSDWGSAQNDARGQILSETMAHLGFSPTNVGERPTYQRWNAESVIDVTFARTMRRYIQDWHVLADYSGSDHNYIKFSVTDTTPITEPEESLTQETRQPIGIGV